MPKGQDYYAAPSTCSKIILELNYDTPCILIEAELNKSQYTMSAHKRES